MAKVRYSKLAAKDLFEYSEFIARDKPVAAYEWVERIEAVCATLAGKPRNGAGTHVQESRPMQKIHEWKIRDFLQGDPRWCRDHPDRARRT